MVISHCVLVEYNGTTTKSGTEILIPLFIFVILN
jgi:hypothetical protein